MKAYYLEITQGDVKTKVIESDNPQDCVDYAKNHVSIAGCDRVQMFDLTGPLECFHDKAWYYGK